MEEKKTNLIANRYNPDIESKEERTGTELIVAEPCKEMTFRELKDNIVGKADYALGWVAFPGVAWVNSVEARAIARGDDTGEPRSISFSRAVKKLYCDGPALSSSTAVLGAVVGSIVLNSLAPEVLLMGAAAGAVLGPCVVFNALGAVVGVGLTLTSDLPHAFKVAKKAIAGSRIGSAKVAAKASLGQKLEELGDRPVSSLNPFKRKNKGPR